MSNDQPLAGLRVLVTGAAGFLGSHLVDALLARGARVTGLDNYVTGRAENIAHLARNAGFTMLEQDVAEPLSGDYDTIFHLACPASPAHYQADPIGTARTCFLGALNALELARRSGAKVLLASSSEVYGDALEHPQAESYRGNVDPTGPRACYDEGKRIAETLFSDYRRKHGLVIRIARIFNTYGPRLSPSDGRVVSNFMVEALKGRDLTVYGDGSHTRSFCYVDDLVRGLTLFMEAPPDLSGPLNLGNPDEITVAELARLIREITGSASRIVHRPLPVDDPRRRRPDISQAMSKLGWSPVVGLREGLERTSAHFRAELAAEQVEAGGAG